MATILPFPERPACPPGPALAAPLEEQPFSAPFAQALEAVRQLNRLEDALLELRDQLKRL